MKHLKDLAFRQIHLDFHTSPDIDGIGSSFDKKLWQERLKMTHANSVTAFACCHHGLCYYPTKIGKQHPGLHFNLLREQLDAAHEIGVRMPIYITAGLNEYIANKEPGWREITPEGMNNGWAESPLHAGYKTLCFNSPYLDFLCNLTAEAAEMFPDADGMFFDIIIQSQCCCPYCMRDMLAEGYDPENEADRIRFSHRTLLKYFERVTAAAQSVRADMPVFHNNGGLLEPNHDEFLPYYTHLELESLPTGGWGYDHFPLLAAYCRSLDHEFLGMTGKFHKSWGEFGGFKHPNALKYECCAMIAQGAKCSIGDQLHPTGMWDESTCRLIGAAYEEVEQKEPWCRNAESVANVAIISDIDYFRIKQDHTLINAEIALSRLLLESHIPFDRVGRNGALDHYKVIILPDNFKADAAMREKLNMFLANGGKLIFAGDTLCCKEDENKMAFELPVELCGKVKEYPNYIEAAQEFSADFMSTPFVMYQPSRQIKVKGGKSLGKIYDPYFRRSYKHFSSHQHTPNKPEASGFDAGILTDNILYFAHPVFTLYGVHGNVILKEFISKALLALIGEELPIHTTLPSQGRVSLLRQKEEKRFVAHALFATPVLRGMRTPPPAKDDRATTPLEVIEELHPLYNIGFSFRLPETIKRITLEPQGTEIVFTQKNGCVEVELEKLICHQMIVLHY